MQARIEIETEIQRKCRQVEFLAGAMLTSPDPELREIALDTLAAALRLEHQRRRTCAITRI